MPLALHAALGVRPRFGPLLPRHARLRPVSKQRARLLLHQGARFPAGPAERHLQAVGVELRGLGRVVVVAAEGDVALVAHLLDLGGAFGVRGEWRRGDGGREGEKVAVEGGEVGEVGGEVRERGGEGFAGWIDGEGEESEGVRVGHPVFLCLGA